MKAETSHVGDLIGDYALDLLPEPERELVKRHVAGCNDCLAALRRERAVGRLIHQTLAAASHPRQDRLERLMRRPPVSRSRFGWPVFWQKPMVLVSIVLLVLIGSFGLTMWREDTLWIAPSPTRVATATMTLNPSSLTHTTVANYLMPLAQPTVAARQEATVALPAIAPVPVAPHIANVGG